MSNCEHLWVGIGRMMGRESRTVDGHDLDWCGRCGGGGCHGGGLPGAADEAADGRICVAENVSGVRVDYAAGKSGLPGVWKGNGGGAGRAERREMMGGFAGSDLELFASGRVSYLGIGERYAGI
jgi:hypothetical protein